MKPVPPNHPLQRGASLIEAVIAIGVLAVAIPLVFGALAEAGKSGLASQAESRSTWIIPACMDEIRASRAGCPRYFTPTTAGQTFPPAGEVWALAFSPDGKPIGKIPQALYDKGTPGDGRQTRPLHRVVGFLAGTLEPRMPLRWCGFTFPWNTPRPRRRRNAGNSISTPACHDFPASPVPRILAGRTDVFDGDRIDHPAGRGCHVRKLPGPATSVSAAAWRPNARPGP